MTVKRLIHRLEVRRAADEVKMNELRGELQARCKHARPGLTVCQQCGLVLEV